MRALKVLKIAFFVLLVATALTYVVHGLWNWLMPSLFGLRMISFPQALGLLVLSKILFGGFRSRPGGPGHWRRRMMERWEQMTPEEREKFRQGMRGRCGPFEPPAESAKS